ncbi:MAG: helix-turn-helix domain-containing protein [Muribaculaceae bacterium]|nr:helix-turn-helix domain-containing protein [Muribaculaceae bacterium]
MGRGFSSRETLLLLRSGYDIPAIAEAKGIKVQTVYGHIAELIDSDMLSDFSGIITRQQYLRVMQVAKEQPMSLYEILSTEMPKGLPKVALAISDFLLRHKAKS